MTTAERDALREAAPDVAATFTDVEPGFVALVARPCPYLSGNNCSVYKARPYNCRRWGCFRPDPKVEPFEPACFWDRFEKSRAVRRDAARLQRRAQQWARQRGWQDSPSDS